MRKRTARLALFVALLLAIPSGAGGGEEGPVFFEKPDRLTAAEIQSALELMRRPYVSDHTRAREILEEIGYWAVAPLLDRLRDGNAAEQRNATLALGTILDHRALAPLLRIAKESSHLYTPSFAALMAGKFRREASLGDLEELIRSGKKNHRKVASVLAVTKIHAERSYEILLSVLRQEKRSLVQETAIFCLGFFRSRALLRGPDGFEVCEPIRIALRSREEDHRRAALLALALLGHRGLKDVYLKFAADRREHPDIRRIAFLALARFPDGDVTDLLISTLGHPEEPESLQTSVALLLKDRKEPAALRKLLGTMPRDIQVKAALTLALGNLEEREAVVRVLARLTDPSDQVRAAAAIALSGLTLPEFKEEAIRVLTEILQGRAGPLHPDVKLNMERSRQILRTGEAPGSFVWMGNEEFAADLPKDVEEKILDLVNREVERVLGLANILEIGFTQLEDPDDPRRISDEHSELRDLKEYLEVHPYFEPSDIPEPELAITPRERPVGAAGRGDVPGGKGEGE